MLSFRKVVGEQADPIPVPFPAPDQYEVRPGHVVLLVGAPGAGKSVTGLLWGVTAHPSVVASLDTDVGTQYARLGSHLSKVPYRELRSDPMRLREALMPYEKSLPWIIDYDPGQDWDGLLNAAKEFYGQPPRLVVVDNLLNFAPETGYEKLREAVRGFVRLAREHGTVVLLLHHDFNANVDGAIPRSEYKLEKEPDSVLYLRDSGGGNDYVPDRGKGMTIAVTKNRHGPMDVRGQQFYSHFYIDFQRMRIT
jgi:hypothetical protein